MEYQVWEKGETEDSILRGLACRTLPSFAFAIELDILVSFRHSRIVYY